MTGPTQNLSRDINAPPEYPGKRIARPSLRSIIVLWIPAILAGGFVVLPLVYLFIRAGGSSTPMLELIASASTLTTVSATLWLAAAVTFCSILIALPIAWLTTRSDIPLRRLWSILTPLPLVIPSYVGAYLLVSTLGPRGTAQQWLEKAFGVTRLPEIYGFPGALYILTILSYPFILLSVRAALKKIDPSQEEASRSLGLNAWQTFWRVTFPQIRPAIAAGSLLVCLYVLRDFGAVSIMRYNTFTRVIYIQYRSTFDRAAAATFSLVLIGLTIVILWLEIRARGRARYHGGSAASSRPVTIIPLGKWRWPSFVFCASVVGASLLMPAVNLGYWVLRGIQAGEQIGSIWEITKNSITASGLAAFGALLAALPVAVVNVRYPNKLSHLLERTTYLAFALPGIVIALALVFFGANYAAPLYQTLLLLVIAYIALFLPEAVGALRNALIQIHPSMEEAARSLGRNPYQVFRQVTLPLVRPGMVAGASLVFLTTMKELPATLILAPIGFQTLATRIWGAVSEAFFARAAVPALILILISSIPTALTILKDNK